jgi:hypothetical protein
MPISLFGWMMGYASARGLAAARRLCRLSFQNNCTGAIANEDENLLISSRQGADVRFAAIPERREAPASSLLSLAEAAD